jgi:hypothetical protein
MSAYALRISDCPVYHPASVPLAAVGPGFPVMSRFLSCQNFSTRGRTERTLLTPRIPLSGGAPSRAASMLRTGVNHHFVCHFTVCYTQVIMHSSNDVSGLWAEDARAKHTGATPSSAVVKTGRHMVLIYTLVRRLPRVDTERKRIS